MFHCFQLNSCIKKFQVGQLHSLRLMYHNISYRKLEAYLFLDLLETSQALVQWITKKLKPNRRLNWVNINNPSSNRS
jgi:hypothetical protein